MTVSGVRGEDGLSAARRIAAELNTALDDPREDYDTYRPGLRFARGVVESLIYPESLVVPSDAHDWIQTTAYRQQQCQRCWLWRTPASGAEPCIPADSEPS